MPSRRCKGSTGSRFKRTYIHIYNGETLIENKNTGLVVYFYLFTANTFPGFLPSFFPPAYRSLKTDGGFSAINLMAMIKLAVKSLCAVRGVT